MPDLLGISGSLRTNSLNRKLIRNAARLYKATDFVEADLRLPLYDGDLEDTSGVPAEVQTLADQIKAADAVVISTPEYNKSISGVLKNALGGCVVGASVRELCEKSDKELEAETGKAFKKDKKVQKGKRQSMYINKGCGMPA